MGNLQITIENTCYEYWPDYVSNLSTLWYWGGDGWTFTSMLSKVGSGMPAPFWWPHWHQRCISGLR